MSQTKLTVAISTLESRLDAALAVFKPLSPQKSVELLVLVQGTTGRSAPACNEGTVRVEFLDSLGLSHSRNAALQLSKGEFVWFLDDDVSINNEDLSWLTRQLSDVSSIYIGQIKCSDCDGMYKDYTRTRKGKLGALRTSSIEIIAPKNKILSAGIRFNTAIGLGTRLPSGEENLFLLDSLQAGLTFTHLNHSIISHPCLLEERKPCNSWRNEGLVKSKGIIARHVGGVTGVALALWWGARATYYNRSPIGLLWVLGAMLSEKPALESGYQDHNR